MIFSKKKITIEYTVEQCTKCGTLTKRKFNDADLLFAELSNVIHVMVKLELKKFLAKSLDL